MASRLANATARVPKGFEKARGRDERTRARTQTTTHTRPQARPHARPHARARARQVLSVQVGYGVDMHGQEPTKAAVKAVKDAIGSVSMPAVLAAVPNGFEGTCMGPCSRRDVACA